MSSKVQISPVENVFSSTAPGDEQKAFGTLSRKLTRAVKEGNLENIKECVRSGGKIEGLDELGYGALHIAVLHGERISLSKHIKGFKINPFCCLMEIKGNRHEHEHLEKIMRYLVKEAKINVDKMDARMQTPLHIATKENLIQTIRILIELDADVNKGDDDGWTPVHYAALKNSRDAIRLLHELSADVNKGDDTGRTPVHYAALENSPDVIRLLHELGADVNKGDDTGRTPVRTHIYIYKHTPIHKRRIL